ncbi:MAG: EF-P lysine aminoacylase GenX [Planctomycetes bacterium]|nr:EF-P lysine aminoacylase GenX [Planctomycetota bacterium]
MPTASLENLHLRADLLKAVRRFFDKRGYLEVETPLISAEATVDPNLIPFVTEWIPPGRAAERGERRYLQTSPEFAMKRLLAAGATAIFQITRAFRNGEQGRLHNPEFTIVEWYRVGDTYHEQMDEAEELVRTVFAVCSADFSPFQERAEALTANGPFARTSYQEAFQRHAGFNPLKIDPTELPQMASSHDIIAPPGLSVDDRDGWLNFLLAERVEPELGQDRPEFLYDYPASQAALARIRPGDPPVAERFELYIRGIEICNGYHELTDADELRRRIREEWENVPMPTRLVEAMEAGLPACSGVALGFDRLVMVAAGASSLDEVIAFPFDRA